MSQQIFGDLTSLGNYSTIVNHGKENMNLIRFLEDNTLIKDGCETLIAFLGQSKQDSHNVFLYIVRITAENELHLKGTQEGF